jgi:predicted RNA binding protein YcfA (HicA-like mRNA interferase family)
MPTGPCTNCEKWNHIFLLYKQKSITTSYVLDNRGIVVGSLAGASSSVFHGCWEKFWEAHILVFNGHWRFALGIKRQRRESGHRVSKYVKVKNGVTLPLHPTPSCHARGPLYYDIQHGSIHSECVLGDYIRLVYSKDLQLTSRKGSHVTYNNIQHTCEIPQPPTATTAYEAQYACTSRNSRGVIFKATKNSCEQMGGHFRNGVIMTDQNATVTRCVYGQVRINCWNLTFAYVRMNHRQHGSVSRSEGISEMLRL